MAEEELKKPMNGLFLHFTLIVLYIVLWKWWRMVHDPINGDAEQTRNMDTPLLDTRCCLKFLKFCRKVLTSTDGGTWWRSMISWCMMSECLIDWIECCFNVEVSSVQRVVKFTIQFGDKSQGQNSIDMDHAVTSWKYSIPHICKRKWHQVRSSSSAVSSYRLLSNISPKISVFCYFFQDLRFKIDIKF